MRSTAPPAPLSSATLRPVGWRDIPALTELEAELFGADAWSAATWWSELAERPRRSYLVLSGPDGTPWGYAGLNHGGAVADVMTIAVAPHAEGRGVGGHLLRQLRAQGRAGGAAHLMLEVRADNGPARRMYERHGFEVIHTRRRYYQPDGVDALVMRAPCRSPRPSRPAGTARGQESDDA